MAVQVVWMPGRVRTEIHLRSEDTGGAFCLLIDEPPVGWSLPPHLHRGAAETIHVVDGWFEMETEGRTSRLGPGETLHILSGVIHSGGNVGSRAGRRIVIFSPAGMEGFFSEVGTPRPQREADSSSALRSARRYGWEFIRQEP